MHVISFLQKLGILLCRADVHFWRIEIYCIGAFILHGLRKYGYVFFTTVN